MCVFVFVCVCLHEADCDDSTTSGQVIVQQGPGPMIEHVTSNLFNQTRLKLSIDKTTYRIQASRIQIKKVFHESKS